MSTSIGNLFAQITADHSQLRQEFSRAQQSVKQLEQTTNQSSKAMNKDFESVEKAAGGLSSALMKIGAAAAAYLSVTAIQRFARESIREFAALEESMWRIERQAQQMGHAWADTEYINKFAREMGRATLGSAQEVRKATSLMLTQKELTRESYEKTIKVAQSYAEVTGQSMSRAARLLTRSMTDASRTMTRFRRDGITFTEAQQDQVRALQESGREAEAYALMLDLLSDRLPDASRGGDTLAHSFDTLGEATRELKEEVGELFAPVVMDALETMIGITDSLTEAVRETASVMKESNSRALSMGGAMLTASVQTAALSGALYVLARAAGAATTRLFALTGATVAMLGKFALIGMAVGALVAVFKQISDAHGKAAESSRALNRELEDQAAAAERAKTSLIDAYSGPQWQTAVENFKNENEEAARVVEERLGYAIEHVAGPHGVQRLERALNEFRIDAFRQTIENTKDELESLFMDTMSKVDRFRSWMMTSNWSAVLTRDWIRLLGRAVDPEMQAGIMAGFLDEDKIEAQLEQMARDVNQYVQAAGMEFEEAQQYVMQFAQAIDAVDFMRHAEGSKMFLEAFSQQHMSPVFANLDDLAGRIGELQKHYEGASEAVRDHIAEMFRDLGFVWDETADSLYRAMARTRSALLELPEDATQGFAEVLMGVRDLDDYLDELQGSLRMSDEAFKDKRNAIIGLVEAMGLTTTSYSEFIAKLAEFGDEAVEAYNKMDLLDQVELFKSLPAQMDARRREVEEMYLAMFESLSTPPETFKDIRFIDDATMTQILEDNNRVEQSYEDMAENVTAALFEIIQQALGLGESAGETARKVVDPFDTVVESLENQIRQLELGAEEYERYNALMRAGVKDINNMTAAEKEKAAQIDERLEQIRKLNAEQEKAQETAEAQNEIERIMADTLSELNELRYGAIDPIQEQIWHIQDLAIAYKLESGEIEDVVQALEDLAEARKKAAEAAEEDRAERERQRRQAQRIRERQRQEEQAAREALRVWERMLDNIQDANADTIRDMLDGNLRSWEDYGDAILDIMKNTFAQVAAAALQQQVVLPIMVNAFGQQSAIGQAAMGMLPSGGAGGFSMPGSGALGWIESNVPGMSWLGSTIPGTAGPGTSGMVFGSGHGAMVGADPGMAWGSALGYGAFGGLGYSLLGPSLGLPQSPYSGLTAGMGGTLGAMGGAKLTAAGGALAGAKYGSVIPVIGTAIGALLGGALGGLFGGGSERRPRINVGAGVEGAYRADRGLEFETPFGGVAGIRDKKRIDWSDIEAAARPMYDIMEQWDAMIWDVLDEGTQEAFEDFQWGEGRRLKHDYNFMQGVVRYHYQHIFQHTDDIIFDVLEDVLDDLWFDLRDDPEQFMQAFGGALQAITFAFDNELDNLEDIIDRIDFTDAEQALADLEFAINFDDLIASMHSGIHETITEIEKSIAQEFSLLSDQFDFQTEKAAELGLTEFPSPTVLAHEVFKDTFLEMGGEWENFFDALEVSMDSYKESLMEMGMTAEEAAHKTQNLEQELHAYIERRWASGRDEEHVIEQFLDYGGSYYADYESFWEHWGEDAGFLEDLEEAQKAYVKSFALGREAMDAAAAELYALEVRYDEMEDLLIEVGWSAEEAAEIAAEGLQNAKDILERNFEAWQMGMLGFSQFDIVMEQFGWTMQEASDILQEATTTSYEGFIDLAEYLDVSTDELYQLVGVLNQGLETTTHGINQAVTSLSLAEQAMISLGDVTAEELQREKFEEAYASPVEDMVQALADAADFDVFIEDLMEATGLTKKAIEQDLTWAIRLLGVEIEDLVDDIEQAVSDIERAIASEFLMMQDVLGQAFDSDMFLRSVGIAEPLGIDWDITTPEGLEDSFTNLVNLLEEGEINVDQFSSIFGVLINQFQDAKYAAEQASISAGNLNQMISEALGEDVGWETRLAAQGVEVSEVVGNWLSDFFERGISEDELDALRPGGDIYHIFEQFGLEGEDLAAVIQLLIGNFNEAAQATEAFEQTMAQGKIRVAEALGETFDFDLFKESIGLGDTNLGLSGFFDDVLDETGLEDAFEDLSGLFQDGEINASQFNAILNELIKLFNEAEEVVDNYSKMFASAQMQINKALGEGFDLDLFKASIGLDDTDLGLAHMFDELDLQGGLEYLKDLLSEGEIETNQFNAILNELINSFSQGQQAAEALEQETENLNLRHLELTDSQAALEMRRQMEKDAIDESNHALLEKIWLLEEEVEIQREQEGLERQLLELKGDIEALRALELENLDESNHALQESIWLLEEEQGIQQEKETLERQLLELEGDKQALRQQELEQLDKSNRALQEEIWRKQDLIELENQIEGLNIDQIGLTDFEVQLHNISNTFDELSQAVIDLGGDETHLAQIRQWASHQVKNLISDLETQLASLNAEITRFVWDMELRIAELRDHQYSPGEIMEWFSGSLGESRELYETEGTQQALSQYISDINSWLSRTISSTTEYYNQRISEVQDAQQKYIEEQRKAIEAQRDALQDQKEATQDQYAAQIEAAQEQLEIAQQWSNVLDNVQQTLRDMMQTSASPLDQFARLDIARQDIHELLTAYGSATGLEQAELGQDITQQAQQYLRIAQETGLHRASDEYQIIWDQVRDWLQMVESDALGRSDVETYEDRIESLQEEQKAALESIDEQLSQLNDAQIDTSHFEQQITSLQEQQQADIRALKDKAIEHLVWAQNEMQKLYEEEMEETRSNIEIANTLLGTISDTNLDMLRYQETANMFLDTISDTNLEMLHNQETANALFERGIDCQEAANRYLNYTNRYLQHITGQLSDLDGRILGGYATGTDYVPRTGPYLLHQGEQVIPAGQDAGEGSFTLQLGEGAIQVHVQADGEINSEQLGRAISNNLIKELKYNSRARKEVASIRN